MYWIKIERAVLIILIILKIKICKIQKKTNNIKNKYLTYIENNLLKIRVNYIK